MQVKNLIVALNILAGFVITSQPTSAQNLPSGMYVDKAENAIYYWDNTRKTACHVVNPVQHRVFMNNGIQNQSGSFSSANVVRAPGGNCLWPNGVYEPSGEGKAFFIKGISICHIPTPRLHTFLAQKFGVKESSSFDIISKGLGNGGICSTDESRY